MTTVRPRPMSPEGWCCVRRHHSYLQLDLSEGPLEHASLELRQGRRPNGVVHLMCADRGGRAEGGVSEERDGGRGRQGTA